MRLIFSSTSADGQNLNFAQLFWSNETVFGDEARNAASKSLGKSRQNRVGHIANAMLDLADSFGRNATNIGHRFLGVAEFLAAGLYVLADHFSELFWFHGFHS